MTNIEPEEAYPHTSWYVSILNHGLTTNVGTTIRRGATVEMNRRPRQSLIYICPALEIDLSSRETVIKQYERELDIRIILISRFQEFVPLINTPEIEFNWVSIDLEHLVQSHGANMFDMVRTIHTLIQCSTYNGRPRAVRIVGVVGDTTDPSIIREAVTIPEISTLCIREGGSISHEQAMADAKRMIADNKTIPSIIRDRINPRKIRTKKEDDSVRLTPRQTQILDLVSTRGASNKVIARMLSISESTVKLHVSAILKKYGCRNRTQLAVFNLQQRDKKPV